VTRLRRWATIQRPFLLVYAAAAAFTIWQVRLLATPVLNGLVWWAALAAAPALAATIGPAATILRRYLAAVAVTLIIAIGLVTRQWPSPAHLIGRRAYLTDLATILNNGSHAWLTTTLPYPAPHATDLNRLVVLASLIVFMTLAAAIFVLRNAAGAIIVTFIPFLVVTTVLQPAAGTLRAVCMLGVAFLMLAVFGGRVPTGSRLAAGGALVLLATAAVAIPGVAKGAFLDWRGVGRGVPKGASVAYIWNQHTYGALHRPRTPVTLLTVHTSNPGYLRAVVLDHFDGTGWDATPRVVSQVAPPRAPVPGSLLSAAASTAPRPVTTVIKNDNLDSGGWLVGPGQALQVTGVAQQAAVISITDAITFRTENSPAVGTSWVYQSVPIQPTPTQLLLAPDYPASVSSVDLALLDQNVQFPVFGVLGREQVVQVLFDQYFTDPLLRRWRDAYAIARAATRNATTPYEAAVALEDYFHTTAFTYDESASYTNAADGPLPAFFLGRRAGYCQMYSGTMTVLLRMLGIPARVAEGFTAGHATAPGTYDVTDRDAHAWVEVYFPQYGWLPFEPTPGKQLAASYSSTSQRFGSAVAALKNSPSAAVTASAKALAGLGHARPNPLAGRGSRSLNEERQAAANGSASQQHRFQPGFLLVICAVAVALLIALQVAKRYWLAESWLRRDPRRVAALVRRDLEGYVADQGLNGVVGALTADELRGVLRREFGVDATGWARAQTRARYGPPGARTDTAARDARREARHVKRRLRRGLTASERAHGAVRLRSLLR
jgi:transglutaminase-like putative cysteine protease